MSEAVTCPHCGVEYTPVWPHPDCSCRSFIIRPDSQTLEGRTIETVQELIAALDSFQYPKEAEREVLQRSVSNMATALVWQIRVELGARGYLDTWKTREYFEAVESLAEERAARVAENFCRARREWRAKGARIKNSKPSLLFAVYERLYAAEIEKGTPLADLKYNVKIAWAEEEPDTPEGTIADRVTRYSKRKIRAR